eukprot:COSAG01_NODE_23_length_37704_cov_30.005877_2_plen_77_part_00
MKNDRIRQATGMTFRPFDESLRDCVESLVAVAGVEAGSFRPKLLDLCDTCKVIHIQIGTVGHAERQKRTQQVLPSG